MTLVNTVDLAGCARPVRAFEPGSIFMARQLAMLQDAMASSRALRLCYHGFLGIIGVAAVIVAITPALDTTW